ncbi:MarR family winged helix-turn-helix transcriptional regulator [Nonomuraea typhae]|uniref:MarR family winged helix-turn-helix transcriptional regulator n=1 Tax=Nonomuraea typhae TaxID=2603600 RepID=UPI0012F7856F|nr:MarR family transcriptional regulator [Nonomuraea typhae]
MEDAAELLELVHRISHRFRRGYRARLEPLGLSPGQARALKVLMEAGEPLRMVRLAEALRIAPRSVTPVVDALEESGLVRREVDPANRRSTLLVLTDAGHAAFGQVKKVRAEVAAELFAPLPPERREALRELLALVDEP